MTGEGSPKPRVASPLSWESTLQQLEAPTPQQRSEAIDLVTELLQESEWQLPEGRGNNFVVALRNRLTDSNWWVPYAALSPGAVTRGPLVWLPSEFPPNSRALTGSTASSHLSIGR